MITTRPVSGLDLELVCRHREEMFREANAFGVTEDVLKTMTLHFRNWLIRHLEDGSYFGFIAEDEKVPVAGIGLVILPWAPHPFHPSEDKRGYILNVYVKPSHRRRKIGERLMNLAEEELRQRGIGFATLHATEAGRALYETRSWAPTTEMFKRL
ncbi:MAG TPA: GNAT family N-acetyltransferase [Rhizomicrobium sp.]|jgi:ribosomal protein S18 acetylase RimI-like enzyme